MSVIGILLSLVLITYVVGFSVLKARDANGGKERRARGKLQKIMESSRKQKEALQKRLEAKALEDSDTSSDDSSGDEAKTGPDGNKPQKNAALALFGAKKKGGKARWTGLKKGLFSVRSFRKQKMTSLIRLKAVCVAAAYYILLFQHQPSSVKTFNMFKCFMIEDTLFLRPDFRLTCFPLTFYHAVAIFVMVFYVFGFPAMTLYVLYKRRNMLADPIVSAELGFLYVPYRPHAYWWEPQIIMHKMLLTAALVPMYQSAIVQCSTAFAISVMSHAMHAAYHPFKDTLLNQMQHMCLFATTIAFVGNLSYQCVANSTGPGGEQKSKGLVKWFITAMFVVAIFTILIFGVRAAKRAFDEYNDVMLGKRQAKKKAEEDRLRRKKAKSNGGPKIGSAGAYKTSSKGPAFGTADSELAAGAVRRHTKFMKTSRKNQKKMAKFLGVHQPKGAEKTSFGAKKTPSKVHVVSV